MGSAVEQCNSLPKRFCVPVLDEDIKFAQATAIPRNTKKCTDWAVNVLQDWRANCCKMVQSSLELPPHLLVCSAKELDTWLSKFVNQYLCHYMRPEEFLLKLQMQQFHMENLYFHSSIFHFNGCNSINNEQYNITGHREKRLLSIVDINFRNGPRDLMS